MAVFESYMKRNMEKSEKNSKKFETTMNSSIQTSAVIHPQGIKAVIGQNGHE